MTASATARRDLVARYAPVFDEVGRDAVARERERRLPYEEVAALRDAGFTRVTLPPRFGGDGATPSELFELLAELARRDPNLTQLLRSHFSFADRILHSPPGSRRDRLLGMLADGSIHGNATFERGPATVGSVTTVITRDAHGLRLDGRKFYSTGTLFADLVSVLAERDGEQVSVLVRTDAVGLERVDDWSGFGQRMTGSGTTVFSDVRIDEDDLLPRDPDRLSHGGSFVQLVLLAAAAGIGRAVRDDAVAYVGARTRGFSHASGATPREDPLVQEVVGDLAALAFAADAALTAASATLDASSTAITADDDERARAAIGDVGRAVTAAQLVILPAVLQAATNLFEVGGASALDQDRALDRHWRNARTLASHNPARYKARDLGAHLLTGAPVASWWSVGEA
ncbi:MAG: acyl-CoA dehydrogenase family protein [Microbacterium sp.]|uniref:acyl-CoA dehydrogenase family protein n=1 Tax=Microbacterium sp. TaxID=51671 RepID=UPI00262C2E92|nr:acyl-CoA dehydrogenase family protein [Microbacterium sp.]MCX6503316.1 acyl-CoA dehydrogenase family protein [Microbacterium sp.]